MVEKTWYLTGQEPNLTNAGLWKLCGVYFISKNMYLPAWEEFENINVDAVHDRLDKAEGIRVIRESIPDWLDSIAEEELGDVWEREIAELNKQADFIIRTNTLKINKNSLRKALKEEETETTDIPNHPDALLVKERKRIFTTTCFQNGWFVQDGSSQEVAYFMDLSTGNPGGRCLCRRRW